MQFYQKQRKERVEQSVDRLVSVCMYVLEDEDSRTKGMVNERESEEWVFNRSEKKGG